MARLCIYCGIIKELDYFVKDNVISGYRKKCKKCHSEYNKRYVVIRRKENYKNKEKIIPNKKFCNNCFIEKEMNEFVKYFSSVDGYRNKCKSCNNLDYLEKSKNRFNKYSYSDQIFCFTCNKTKKHNEFGITGLRKKLTQCKECVNFLHKNQSKSMSNSCLITRDQYNDLLVSQNNVCAICKNPETLIRNGKNVRLSVDHCHESEKLGINKIRGLLCQKCNTAIGQMDNCTKKLMSAIKYIESANGT